MGGAEIDLPNWLFAVLAAPFIGSFLGVVIRRLPEGRPIVAGHSTCDHCGARLGPSDLVPLATWLWNRGKCRHCGASIGFFYPGIELAALAVAVASVAADGGVALWIDCVLGWWLLTLAWIDIEHFLLPDALTLPLIPAGLAVTYFVNPDALLDRALGAALGYLVFRGVALAYRRLRGRDGLGEGDAKLLAAAGAWLGWEALPWLVLVAALAALAAVALARLSGQRWDSGHAVPFGPFLAFGFFLLWLYGFAQV